MLNPLIWLSLFLALLKWLVWPGMGWGWVLLPVGVMVAFKVVGFAIDLCLKLSGD